MRRRIAIVVFSLGTVFGYGSGFAHIARAHHAHCSAAHAHDPPTH